MIRLNLKREPVRVDLGGGAWIEFAPLTSAVMAAARQELPEETGGLGREELVVALVSAVARKAALAWHGVCDAEGAALPLTEEAVGALMDWWPAQEAVNAAYLAPYLRIAAEGNV